MRTAFVLLLVVVAGAVAATRATTGRGAPGVVHERDLPSGREQPLGPAVRAESFSLASPADAQVRHGDDVQPLTVRLGRGAALLVVRFPDLEPDAAAAVADLRGHLSRAGWDVGRARDTRVGTTPAVAIDMTRNTSALREFRFVHDGVVWGAGILTREGDTAALDTGLAMLRTWRWTE